MILVILDSLRLPLSTSDIFVTLPCWFILIKVMYRDKYYPISYIFRYILDLFSTKNWPYFCKKINQSTPFLQCFVGSDVHIH